MAKALPLHNSAFIWGFGGDLKQSRFSNGHQTRLAPIKKDHPIESGWPFAHHITQAF
jgi:hypothetical protein